MSDDLCHDCPRRPDCLICDSPSVPERCTYAIHAREAEAAFARMVAARADRQMMNRVIGAIALSTGSTPRQVRDRLQKGGIRQ